MANEVEEGAALMLDFSKLAKFAAVAAAAATNVAAAASVADTPGVVPVAVQNADTKEVILVAYANETALRHAMATRTATFWSTSRSELWVKGATSGETFDLLEVRVNCEQNSLLYLVRPRHGGICHTRNRAGEPRNCFYRRIDFETGALENLDP